jgi:hypothetical protein
MQFLPGFEADRFAWSNAHFGSRAGIATDSGFAGANAEYAESAQFDAFAGGQSLLQALEYRIHRGLRLGARKTRALDYMMDDVLFNQRGNLVGTTGLNVLRPAKLMLQIFMRLWNSENRFEQLSPKN